MADAKIITYGEPFSATTDVIPDNQSVALNIESTDAEKYVSLDTSDNASKVLLLSTHTEADNESSGLVGIRAPTPLAPLHIIGTGGSTGSYSLLPDPTDDYSPTVYIENHTGNSKNRCTLFMNSGGSSGSQIDMHVGGSRSLNFSAYAQAAITSFDRTMELVTTGNYALMLKTNSVNRLNITGDGKVGIGETVPLMQAALPGLHIKSADAGHANVHADWDELVLEGTAASRSGMTIMSTGSSAVGGIAFSDSGSAEAGMIRYDHGMPGFQFKAEGTTRYNMGAADANYQDMDLVLQANSTDAVADSLIFHKSQNATDGSHTIVADNDVLGTVEWKGSDGNSFAPGAKIFARVNGTPGDGDMPTELVFATSRDGTETPLEYMRLSNIGTLQLLNHEGENRFSFSSDADDATLQMDSASGSTRTVLKSATTGSYMRYSALNLGNNNTTSEGQLHVVVGTSNTAGGGAISVVNNRNCIKCEMDDTTNNPIVVDLANTGTGDAIKYAGPSSKFFHVKSDGDCENTNNSYGGISDRRLKENITDATSKLSDINKLQVRNFNFIGDDLKQIGLVADEVAEVFPGLVKSSAARTYSRTESVGDDGQIEVSKELIGGLEDQKSVKYSVLVPMLIKAVQELSARIEELENNGN